MKYPSFLPGFFKSSRRDTSTFHFPLSTVNLSEAPNSNLLSLTIRTISHILYLYKFPIVSYAFSMALWFRTRVL